MMKKKMMKIISFLLCFFFLLPSWVVAAEPETAVVSDAMHMQNIDFLTKIGVIREEEDTTATYGVSRRDAAIVVARILGNTTLASSGQVETKFIDLNGYEPEEVAAINLLTDLKIISGTSANTFSPEEYITGEQIAKILVSALGYGDEAEEKGGYPFGYTRVGTRLGLFDEVYLANSEYLTWGAFAQLLRNALEIDIFQTVTYGGKQIKLTVEGETLLSNVLKIKKAREVIVTANAITSLNGSSETKDGYVGIDGTRYADPDGLAAAYIGSYVNVYYTQSNNAPVIVYVEQSGSGDCITIPISDIKALQGYTMVYDNGDKEKSLKLASDTRMIINGIAKAYDSSLIDTNLSGEVIVKRSGTSAYDVVVVSQYSSFIIESIDYTNEVIYDKINVVRKLDLKELIQNNRCSISIYGKDAEFSELSIGLILAVYQSPDKDYIRITADKNMVSGTITKRIEDKLWVNDTEYVLAKEQKNAELLEYIGKQCEVYLNIDQEVIFISKNADGNESYGYLIAGSTQGTFEQTVVLKILSDNGIVKVLRVADRADINNVQYDKSAEAVLDLLYIGAKWQQQLLKYQTNADGEIIVLKTAGTNWLKAEEGDFYCSHEKEKLTYRKDKPVYTFGMKYMLDTSTKVFVVPTGESDNEEDFAVKSITYFANNTNYNVAAYDTSKAGYTGVVVCWSNLNSASTDKRSNNIMVDFIASSLDEEGNPVKVLSGIMNGAYTEAQSDGTVDFTVKDANSDIRELERGDIIYAAFNNKSKICAIRLLYDVKNSAYIPLEGTPLNSNWTIHGLVYSKDGNYALVSKTADGMLSTIFADVTAADLYAINLANSTVVICDRERDRIYLGTVDDLQSYVVSGEDGTKFVARMNYSHARYIFVYK